MEQIVFKVPKGTKARLNALAAQFGDHCTVSDLVRQALDAFLKTRLSASAYEKAPHLCGCAAMPSDAATSQEYLQQYARD